MLAPFLASQKTRLDEHSAALTQLRRENSVFRASLSNMQEMLGLRSSEATYDRPASDQLRTTQPSSETTEAHLLALHEDMRQEVAQLSQAISALDAKASTMIVNQGLCQTEEMAHANGVIGNLRMQVQYLIEAKQREQRAAMMRSRSTAESGAATLARVRDGSAGPAGGVEASANGPPVRRLSDSNRQDPKL
ncbi:hypothetical protein MMC19_003343 [Ptychographa xylographoides]|nr:hypothetical protein [Ptychographa xylographoides]